MICNLRTLALSSRSNVANTYHHISPATATGILSNVRNLESSKLYLRSPNYYISSFHGSRYSTSSKSSLASVDLHSSIITPTTASSSSAPDVLIFHGLFGQSSNWRGIAKKLADNTQRRIHLVDLRNHGSSPHSFIMNYELMEADTLRYLDKHHLPTVAIVGHSMVSEPALPFKRGSVGLDRSRIYNERRHILI